MELPAWTRQSGYDLRFDWGPAGVASTATPGATVVIVDVLRFTTAVAAAVEAGARVYPYRWRDDSAAAFALEIGAVLADGRDAAGASLSPASLVGLPTGTAVVLPSPNGSTCAVLAAEAGASVVAGCLRNAAAVADWISSTVGPVSVVASGERWPDGSMRPAVEDLVGAGAILARCRGEASPEAAAAIAAFAAVEGGAARALDQCSSARELREKGRGSDVDYAFALDASRVVPVLSEGAFVSAPARSSGRWPGWTEPR